MTGAYISKSKYLVGLQCAKLLWTHYNAKEQIPPVDEQTQSVFDQGHEVGLLAQKLFPDGITVGGDLSLEQVIDQTRRFLKKRKPLFEPGFSHKRGFARLDVLNPIEGNEWEVFEVKSGTSAKDPNWDDVAFQRFCCEGAGLKIRGSHLMYVNNRYVRRGAIDPTEFFVQEDITDTVREKSLDLEDRLKEMLRTIELRQCPHVAIGPHCAAPYPCPLQPVCWREVNEVGNNIFTLSRLGSKAWPFYRNGIVSNEDIPPDFVLSPAQGIQIEVERTKIPHVDRAAVSEFLEQLRRPLFFLDFETFQTAIPQVEGIRPWQQVPFQFSLHVSRSAEADPAHFSWLWDGIGDPRKSLLDHLEPLFGGEGSIVVFNASFETTRLKECVEANPQYAAWLEDVLERIVDLLAPFRSFDVYFPGQHGSASMKRILPALTGKNYDALAIQEGSQASEAFKRITFGDVGEEERRKVRKNLEEYCGLDTSGMVEIVEVLAKLAKGS